MNKMFFKAVGFTLITLIIIVIQMLVSSVISCFYEKNYMLAIFFSKLIVMLFLACVWIVIQVMSKD